jgi:hypothetical protein
MIKKKTVSYFENENMIIFLFRPPLKLVFPVGYKINRTKDNSDHFSNLTQLEPFYILFLIGLIRV